MFQLHGWRDTADAQVGACVIIFPKPPGGKTLYFLKTFKKMLIESVITHCPIRAFNIAVLLRFSRLNGQVGQRVPKEIPEKIILQAPLLKKISEGVAQ